MFQRLHPDRIQSDYENTDVVDRDLNLHRPRAHPGSTFHYVTLGSFDLYAV